MEILCLYNSKKEEGVCYLHMEYLNGDDDDKKIVKPSSIRF